ncbi:putative 3-methylcrotonyl-CoA carboxylase [Trypanosoma rangeli]|uniref:Putative 3-methylcrotonyl-CoA carboxylase n=1 Tax=Trypanosoma rangeli TaxID=5698 RepID=A0A3S5IR10_TRYRA|nr:putative 3-methylcrotonyl-CoA carboxylase [Trypanosoma rangeli]RNF03652.1 putative 3-methylcrotonyl-CoA carboxylase [Trypanosoma rangeli]|eukprot:RNF03652.1 putative 3-methylcrotonyl-CoA carboxylase [Trypanosoma rangeli]
MGDNLEPQQLVERLGELLTMWAKEGGSSELAGQLLKVYWRFMRAVHHDLVLREPQGAALATAACIPVWEMLHFYGGSFGGARGASRAFVLSLLTALYPKTKDRRCLYQHSGCVGGLGFPRVPLTNRLPMWAEVIRCPTNGSCAPGAYGEVVGYVQNTVSAEECILGGSSLNGLKAKIKVLMEDVLPHCRFVTGDAEATSVTAAHPSAIVISMAGDPSASMQSQEVFKQAVWKYLVFLHVYLPEERRALGNYLTTSAWSQQSVRLADDSVVTYAAIMAPIVHEAAVCVSLMPSFATDASDNAPLFHPRVLEMLLPKAAANQDFTPCLDDLSKAFVPDKIRKRDVSVAHATVVAVRELLEESIPQEITLFGESTSCRDCDKLTQFCRDVLLSPITQHTAAGGVTGLSPRAMRSMLFSRKRRRDDGFYEGPVFLPIASSLSEMLDEKAANQSLSALERIVTASASL